MAIPAMDSNFVAEEMELYDEIRSTLDEDELLIIMSRLQEHFLENLEYQNEQRRLREDELNNNNTDNNNDDTDNTSTAPNTPKSMISSTSHNSHTSPIPLHNTFAYPDDATNPFQLPPINKNKNTFKFKNKNKNKKNKNKNGLLTSDNLKQHNNTRNKRTVSNTSHKSNRSSNSLHKLKYNNHNMRPISQSVTSQSVTSPSSITHMTVPIKTRDRAASAGTYRLDLFCDIKFVKTIFLRWISSDNNVLCHVASRTLGILFSHSFLTPDQFLDLAELLLGVHEDNTLFNDVSVTYRTNRTGMLYNDILYDSSSSPIDSDYQSSGDPIMSDGIDDDASSDDDDDIAFLLDNSNENNNNTKNKPNPKKSAAAAANSINPTDKMDIAIKINNGNDIDAGADADDDDDDIDAPMKSASNSNLKSSKPPSVNPIIENKEQKGYDNLILTDNISNNAKQRRSSGASTGSNSSRKSKLSKIPYDVHWHNRFYSTFRILSYIVSNTDVYEGCVVALDEWFSLIVMDLFHKSRKAGIGVLEGFLYLIKSILIRFSLNRDIMGQCKLSVIICNDPSSTLLEIITSKISTLVTRASALEICPLLMITSDIGKKIFAQQCLIKVLDDGRFNPFEPGDIAMSRTFQRGEQGQLRSIDAVNKNTMIKSYTVANYVSSLLFQNTNNVFLDQETVQRYTFLCVIKAMNILSQQIIAIDDDEKDDNKNKKKVTFQDKKKKKKKKKNKNKDDDDDIDMDQTASKLEGEFDSSTARKIRNFFSRDAEYTRFRILELISEEDDILIETLLELLLIESALRKSSSRLAKKIRYLFDPFMLFYDFIYCIDADYLLLMDFLISSDNTLFLEYLLKFCRRMTSNYHPTSANKNQVNAVMSILIRLRMHIQTLYSKKLFPNYSPKALLKAMEKMEFCYENDVAGYNVNQNNDMFDPDYINYIKQKEIKKKEKQKQDKLKKEIKKKKKPKKMVVSSLFLQDIKYQKELKIRNDEIKRKQKVSLAKRKTKNKVKKNNTVKKPNYNDDMPSSMTPTLTKQPSMAHSIMKHCRKKNINSSLKRKKNKLKKNKNVINNLKKINFKKKLNEKNKHQVVNADKTVRIGF